MTPRGRLIIQHLDDTRKFFDYSITSDEDE